MKTVGDTENREETLDACFVVKLARCRVWLNKHGNSLRKEVTSLSLFTTRGS